MDSPAAGLLAELHGHCLRALGKAVGGEFDGLSTMARAALKRGLISALLKKAGAPRHRGGLQPPCLRRQDAGLPGLAAR